MSQYLDAVRPVLFENEDEEFAYSGRGSSILLATQYHQYWVTAAHVIQNQKRRPDEIRVFPGETSRSSLPFDQAFQIPSDGVDTDWADLCILRIDQASFQVSGDTELVGQAVPEGILPASSLRSGDELVVIGFPDEGRSVDYDTYLIKYRRRELRARYQGSTESQRVHELRFDDDHGLCCFQGLSGAPVFSFRRVEQYVFPFPCGVILRGGVTSETGRFVDAAVINAAIAAGEA